jgi:hypothetical protein
MKNVDFSFIKGYSSDVDFNEFEVNTYMIVYAIGTAGTFDAEEREELIAFVENIRILCKQLAQSIQDDMVEGGDL